MHARGDGRRLGGGLQALDQGQKLTDALIVLGLLHQE